MHKQHVLSSGSIDSSYDEPDQIRAASRANPKSDPLARDSLSSTMFRTAHSQSLHTVRSDVSDSVAHAFGNLTTTENI
ncbi:hypothetical protein CTheo_3541 [Ceratobasidium theobromae]|uniref:Uncharacterized protein n=1 Tax=Ceratobasidium theobromae TaxID=1582974 RepID=A0A5N5QP00_9AGAM|nr:hypothetical protein CTheo_3541 [Ceratobasidium theobromae]